MLGGGPDVIACYEFEQMISWLLCYVFQFNCVMLLCVCVGQIQIDLRLSITGLWIVRVFTQLGLWMHHLGLVTFVNHRKPWYFVWLKPMINWMDIWVRIGSLIVSHLRT